MSSVFLTLTRKQLCLQQCSSWSGYHSNPQVRIIFPVDAKLWTGKLNLLNKQYFCRNHVQCQKLQQVFQSAVFRPWYKLTLCDVWNNWALNIVLLYYNYVIHVNACFYNTDTIMRQTYMHWSTRCSAWRKHISKMPWHLRSMLSHFNCLGINIDTNAMLRVFNKSCIYWDL